MNPQNNTILNLFAAFAFASLFVYVLVIGQRILIPFVIALLIAYFISAIADSIANFRVLRIPIFKPFALLFSFAIVFGALYIVGDVIIENANRVAAQAPAYEKSLDQRLIEIGTFLKMEEIPSVTDILAEISGLTNTTWKDPNIAALFQTLFAQVTGIAGNMLAILVYTAFLIYERQTIPLKIAAMAKDNAQREKIEATLRVISDHVRRYLAVKSLASSLVAMLSYVVMLIIGIDFALFWAVLTFLLNFIPYLGSIVAVMFPITLTLVQPGFEDPLTTFVITLIALIGCQQLVGSFIEPRLMGRTLNLSPLMILLSLAIWWSIWGVIGMLISIPIMVILVIIFSQFETTRPIAVMMSQRGQISPMPHNQR
ncbi:MAG: AI-2E family transporter [Alphaproteobacteria bacterium]|nr:MAG: AI-2E family transporter [Alphaproteobacteria bacterium]